MKAIIFPGQGSQKAGMANEFEKNFKVVKEIFSQLYPRSFGISFV